MARSKGPGWTGPTGRGPSLRGSLMIDTAGGQTRIRRWPRPRGKSKTAAQQARVDWFSGAQMVARYISPRQLTDMTMARTGTPILPRDILTCMLSGNLIAISMLDGRTLYSMAGKTQVSEALDSVTQTPGMVLIRGLEFWEAFPYTGEVGEAKLGQWSRVAAALNVTGDGTWWQVAFDTATLSQPWLSLNTGTGALTAQEAGNIEFHAYAQFNGASNGDFWGARILKNGVVQIERGCDITNMPWAWPELLWTVPVVAGDVITVEMRVGGSTKIYDCVPGAANTTMQALFFN